MSIEFSKSQQGHFFSKKAVMTPLGRAVNIWLQYPKVVDVELKLNPKFPDSKFQIELLVPKANKHLLRELYEVHAALIAAATAPGEIWAKLTPDEVKAIRFPWIDADADPMSVKKYPHYAGMYRLHPKKKAGARTVVDPTTGKQCPPYWEGAPKVIGPTQEPFAVRGIVPGHWCRASVYLFTYNGAPEKVRNGNTIETVEVKGVTMKIDVVQYWKPGDAIVFAKNEPSDSDLSAFATLPEGETAPPAPAKWAAPQETASTGPATAGDGMPF